jgi:hypothetical protein
MKKIAFLSIFAVITISISAQTFLGTISSSGSSLIFTIRPTGGDITSALGYCEFCIRYTDATNITFSNVAINTLNTNPATGFPGLSIAEGPERSFGGYKYKRFVATVSIASQTYRNNTDYKVFEVRLSSAANPLDIQLVTDYGSIVPNDYYFVVSTGAGEPLVDVNGVQNFYPLLMQGRTGTTQYFTLSNIILPVELLSFEGEQTKEGNLLNWQTASEISSSHFDIERSVDGKTFQKAGSVKAQNKAARYDFLDKYPLPISSGSAISKTTYYRLKINDLDGQFSYSNVVSITTQQKGLFAKIYPNPFVENLTIDISTEKKSDITIELTNVIGEQVYQSKAANTEGVLTVSIPTKVLPNGTYFLKVSDGQTEVQKKIMKQ